MSASSGDLEGEIPKMETLDSKELNKDFELPSNRNKDKRLTIFITILIIILPKIACYMCKITKVEFSTAVTIVIDFRKTIGC